MAHNNNNNKKNVNSYDLVSLLIITLLVVIVEEAAEAVTDGETLLQFKKSLSNDTELANWSTSIPLCIPNTNDSNWKGLTCVNGSLYGLRLENMGLGGTIDVYTLSKLPTTLRSLSVIGNHFGGGIPEFKVLRGLRALYLSYNDFSGDIPDDSFEGMVYLKKVYLDRNEFDGRLPNSIVRLTKLVELNVESNRFVGRIPEFPRQDWKFLSFANNQFQGPIPSTLSNANVTAFLGNKELCGPPLGSTCKSSTSSNKKKKHIIIMVILVTLVVAVIASIVFLCFRRARTKTATTSPPLLLLQPNKHGSTPPKVVNYEQFGAVKRANYHYDQYSSHNNMNSTVDLDHDMMRSSQGYKKRGSLQFVMKDRERFELEDLLRASAEVLGSGSFGSSYKALLLNGPAMVVKRFSHMNNVGREEYFHDYMAKLGRLSHPNLLPLVAYYYRKEEKLLISDFVDNQSLASHLHGNKRGVGLDWATRLSIIKGISRGLTYLYKEFPDVALPHGHLKSSNVLLDQKFSPILTEYALVPLTNKDHAHRFMAAFKSPEFSSNNNNNKNRRISRKTDIWSLGILILEILTGKFPENYVDQGNNNNKKKKTSLSSSTGDLAAWVNSVVREEWTGEVFDKEMVRSGHGEGEMLKLLKIGMSCSEMRVERRLDWKEAAERIEELRERDSEDEDYSSYVTDWDVLSADDAFSFSLKH